jgi:hypothetical protein
MIVELTQINLFSSLVPTQQKDVSAASGDDAGAGAGAGAGTARAARGAGAGAAPNGSKSLPRVYYKHFVYFDRELVGTINEKEKEQDNANEESEHVWEGAVALQAEGYSGAKVGYLGVFKWQERVLQGRPTYKKPGKDEYLFYTNEGFWKVGSDTSKAVGDWSVMSTARTPSAITEPWRVFDGSEWVKVPAAKVVQATAQVSARVNCWQAKVVLYFNAIYTIYFVL